MSRFRRLVAIGLSLIALNVTRAAAQSGGAYGLKWSTFDGGGATFSSGGGFTLGATIGQPDASRTLSGTAYALTGGFWAGVLVEGAPTPTTTPTRTNTATPTVTTIPTTRSTITGTVRPTFTRTVGHAPTPTAMPSAAAITPTQVASRGPSPTVTITPTPDTTATGACAGDCDDNRRVRSDELVRGVHIGLGTLSLRVCPALDANRDQATSIDELVMAVSNALNGCPDLDLAVGAAD